VLPNRPVLRQAFAPVLSFLAVGLAAVGGFAVLGGVGVVEAAYWVISPANVGIHFRSTTGGPVTAAKALAVATRAGLVVTGLWIGQTVVTALFGGQITEEFKRVQQQRTIESLEGHVVVCGYGMFGRTIAERLEADDRRIVVVEINEEEMAEAEQEGHLVVDGDGRSEAVLERAGVADADTVVTAVDDSNVNIQIAIVARQLAPDARLVVRVGEEMYESMAKRAGADDVVIPEVLSGEDIATTLEGGG
jgi:voltage-gated potassium channel